MSGPKSNRTNLRGKKKRTTIQKGLQLAISTKTGVLRAFNKSRENSTLLENWKKDTRFFFDSNRKKDTKLVQIDTAVTQYLNAPDFVKKQQRLQNLEQILDSYDGIFGTAVLNLRQSLAGETRRLERAFTDEQISPVNLSKEGAFAVFHADNTKAYEMSDEAFERFDQSGPRATTLVAVLDTGIYAKTELLEESVTHVIDSSGHDKQGEAYQDDISDFHGTKVASQVLYGSKKIKLVDLRGQAESTGGLETSHIARGLRAAIEEGGATIVTASLDFSWGNPDIQAVVNDHPEVLFITSGGNNDTELLTRKIDGDGPKRPNALLVGGITNDGKKHDNRGRGRAVDVTVPSGKANDQARGMTVLFPLLAKMKTELKSDEKKLEFLETKLAEKKKNREASQKQKSRLAGPTSNRPGGRPAMPAFLQNIQNQTGTDLRNTDTEAEQEIEALRKIILEKEAELKKQSENRESTLGSESGVSFGIPVIANIAAKMKLIYPDITPEDITFILKNIAVSKVPGLEDISESGGVVDPVKAYQAAALLRDQRNKTALV